MATTSLNLLQRLRQPNEQAAWTQFVEIYTPLIFYWARSAGPQSADAADLVQEVFAVLVRKMPSFAYDKKKSFRGWLRTITLNKWRERSRQRPLPTLEDQETALNGLAVSDDREALDEAEYRRHLLRNQKGRHHRQPSAKPLETGINIIGPDISTGIAIIGVEGIVIRVT